MNTPTHIAYPAAAHPAHGFAAAALSATLDAELRSDAKIKAHRDFMRYLNSGLFGTKANA
jgi:hypothetical protein